MAEMRVLVTGVDGYIGAVLAPRLLEHGFDVVGADCGFYRDGWLYNDDRPRPLTFTKDVRPDNPEGCRRVRRGRASRGTVERPARRAKRTNHV
jgi:nucleoside-diphosphate-sugar epimerase